MFPPTRNVEYELTPDLSKIGLDVAAVQAGLQGNMTLAELALSQQVLPEFLTNFLCTSRDRDTYLKKRQDSET